MGHGQEPARNAQLPGGHSRSPVQKNGRNSRIGMQRLKIAAISRADLLTLKLDVVNARNTLQNAASALKRAMFSLASFLNMEKNTDIRVSLPGRPRALTIPVDEALLAAQANNPEFLGLRDRKSVV